MDNTSNIGPHPLENINSKSAQAPQPQVLKKVIRRSGEGQKSQRVGKYRRQWRWIASTLIILTVFGAGSVYWVSRRRLAEPDLTALTAPVKTQDLMIRVEASGTVKPISSVNISPKTTGQLAALYVDQGDEVKTGEILARMDSARLEAELTQAKAQLQQMEAVYKEVVNGSRREDISQARASVNSARATADLSAVELLRYRNLAGEGAISQNELDQYIAADRSAKANLEEAQQQLQELLNGSRVEEIEQAAAQVAAALAQIEIIQTQLDDTVIRAPFDGIVTQKYATIGAIVTPTTSASATASATSSSIVALASSLEIVADAPETDIAQVNEGQLVEIVAESYPNRTFEGRVTQIAPEAVVEDNVTSFEVKVELVTGQSTLLSGMNVDVTFLGETVADALVIPTVTITSRQGRLGVLVANDQGEARFQPVTVGLSQDGQTQILEGLTSSERVFIDFPENEVSTPSSNGSEARVMRSIAR